MEPGNLSLNRNAREILVLHILNSIEEQNDLLSNPSMFLTKFHELSTVSQAFHTILKWKLEKTIQFKFPATTGQINHLLDIQLSSNNRIRNLGLNGRQLAYFLRNMASINLVSNGIPPVFVARILHNLLLPVLEFNSHRFFHCVELASLVSNYGEKPVPPFPEVYEQRVSKVSYFYEGISMAFPVNKLTYVYLPPLFLKTQSTKCIDASFEISVVTKADPYNSRIIYQMKEDSEAVYKVNEIFSGDHFDYVTECEGLVFTANNQFKDPSNKFKRRYAFKLSDNEVRILIKVNCGLNGVNLINRCLQTARLYMSILHELPTLFNFDVAVVIDLNRESVSGLPPFVFRDTIASKIRERSANKARSVSSLVKMRPDLSWFTKFCNEFGTYRAYAHGYYPQNQCLWIVDAKTY